jgi:hypothetical protein
VSASVVWLPKLAEQEVSQLPEVLVQMWSLPEEQEPWVAWPQLRAAAVPGLEVARPRLPEEPQAFQLFLAQEAAAAVQR